MAHPDPGVLAWASGVLGSEVTAVRSVRPGGSPWLLRAGDRNVVLRAAPARRTGETETEVAAMTHVARVAEAGLPVPELLGYDLAEQTGYALLLTGQVAGSSVIPAEPDPERLRALGAVAARISSVTLSPARALPVRHRPIEAEDFARMRREQGASDLLHAAEAAVAKQTRPGGLRPEWLRPGWLRPGWLRPGWPEPGRMMAGPGWCTATCGMAARCGTMTAA